MHVLRIARCLAKARVEFGDELWHVGVRRLDRLDAAQAQFLNQPILQRSVGPFDTALGLGRVGADDVDVQFVKCSAELRQTAGPIHLRTVCRAENAMLVAIEGQRFAPFAEIGRRGAKIVECVLRCCKT